MLWEMEKKTFTNFKNFAEISTPFCSLEVKIKIESLAMQNCESRNCQFSGKSRNIQNCFWRPSPQFTSYTWISMTLDILCCRQKLKTCMKQMFSKHFKTFHISQSHVLKSKKCFFIAVSSSGTGSAGDQKVLVLFSLLLRGEIGYEIKTERRMKLKT